MNGDKLQSDPLWRQLGERLLDRAASVGLDADQGRNLMDGCLPAARWLEEKLTGMQMPYLLGVNGAQGSGKTTFANLLQLIMREGFGRRSVCLGIDDFYKTRKSRQALAAAVHPLLKTRGVPGTHDMELAWSVVDGLLKGEKVSSPRFDKALDDRSPETEWLNHAGPLDLVLFEGWCVGANSQPDEDLERPLNSLEEDRDADLVWRRYVNSRLQKGAYRQLYDRLDGLLMLKVPDMDAVYRWRWQQEEQLRLRRGSLKGIMTRQQVREFIMHYERLTRHMLREMPKRADLVINLDTDHRLVETVVLSQH